MEVTGGETKGLPLPEVQHAHPHRQVEGGRLALGEKEQPTQEAAIRKRMAGELQTARLRR